MLRLACGNRQLWLELGSGDPLSAPFLPRFTIDGMAGLPQRLLTLKRFAGLVRTGAFQAAHFAPPMRAARLALLLRAHDGWASGASQRRMASVLFGTIRVEEDWNSPSDYLRSRMRRLICESRRMAASGYLSLLD